jgi:hypothetical protein
MKKKLQVFVSSTYVDMLPERQAAVEAVLRAGHIPAGMELFASGDESQWETIRSWIDDSDLFVLILGGRYGSLEPNSGKSYIELEYEYASKKKKPLFAAVISEVYLTAKVKSLGPDAMERTNGHLLQAFRETVTKKICRFFGDTNELKLIVFESLSNFERNESLVGWIRGSDVIDPKATLEEISRLQAENTSLKSQIKDLETLRSSVSPSDEEGGVASLSEDAINLLVTAKNDDGHIMYIRYTGGSALQAGNKNFIDPENSPREDARWKAALNELIERGLVESLGYKGETFQVTKLGYDVADEIEKSIGQQPTEPGAAADGGDM